MDGREEGAAYHPELHALLVSNRGVALDKDGTGFVPGRKKGKRNGRDEKVFS